MSSNKILFLTSQLPYPPQSGGTIKSWNYVRFLAQHNTLSIACLLKNDDEQFIESFQKALPIQELFTHALQVSRSPVNLLKSYFLARSLNLYRNHSTSFQQKIESISSQFDLLIVDHYEMFQYVPKTYKGKVILHTHNAEFMLWQRMSELSSNPIKKFILYYEARRVKNYEKHIFDRVDLVYATPSDIELYGQNGFDTEKICITYHLGNDRLLNLPELEFQETEKAITFLGTLSWEPNIDGICWFLDYCWPIIEQKHPQAKVYILGRNPDERIIKSAKNHPQVIFTGFVERLDDYLKKTRVYIAPLRFGSGMKVKVLEGMYRGNPTVSTTVGVEGLYVRHSQEVMIADEPKDFAAACIDLLDNQSLWEQLKDNSRELAKEKYRWLPLFRYMNTKMEEVLLKNNH